MEAAADLREPVSGVSHNVSFPNWSWLIRVATVLGRGFCSLKRQFLLHLTVALLLLADDCNRSSKDDAATSGRCSTAPLAFSVPFKSLSVAATPPYGIEGKGGESYGRRDPWNWGPRGEKVKSEEARKTFWRLQKQVRSV